MVLQVKCAHLSSYPIYIYICVLLQVKCTHLSSYPCVHICVVTGEVYTPVFIPCVYACVVTGEMCHTCLHTLGAPSGQSGHAALMGVHLHTGPWPGIHRVTAQHTACTDGIIQGLQLRHTVCGGGSWLWPGDER